MKASQEMEDVRSAFSGAVPMIFTVLDAEGLVPLYWPPVKCALIDEKGIRDRRVTQGLMVALSTRCDNGYCFVAHSYFLHGLGFTIRTITDLVETLDFPDEMADSEKWSVVLKWSFFFGYPPDRPGADPRSSAAIRKLISAGERRHLYKICVAMDILTRFSQFYSDQVRIENEPMFLDPSGHWILPIPDLAKYYERLSESRGKGRMRVVTICMDCKKIRDAAGKWHSLETVLPTLTGNCSFSHGMCADCARKRGVD